MVLQAYVDDSFDSGAQGARKAYVLAGCIAHPENWAKFSTEWEQLLPTARQGKSGKYRFKMAEMQYAMQRVPPFYKVFSENVEAIISVCIYEDDLQRAKDRIWSDNTQIMYTHRDSGAFIAKRLLAQQLYLTMDDPSLLHFSRGTRRYSDFLRLNRDKIDLYFDADSAEDWLKEWWDDYVAFKSAPREAIGDRIRFLDDEEFLPLQAADFIAWWARRAYATDGLAALADGDFGSWRGAPLPPTLSLTASEDQLTEYLIAMLIESAPVRSMVNIYDAKKKSRSDKELPVHEVPNRASMLSVIEKLLRRLRRGR